MEKQIRNARKRVSPPHAAERRRLSPLSVQSSDTRETLFTLPIGENGRQQRPKTVEIENGDARFYIIVPCAPAEKPDRVTPLYLVVENELGGPESGVWQCQECTAIFRNRRSWEKHKGIDWIVQSGTKVCQ